MANESFAASQSTVRTIDVDNDGQFDLGDAVTSAVIINHTKTDSDAHNITLNLGGDALSGASGTAFGVSGGATSID